MPNNSTESNRARAARRREAGKRTNKSDEAREAKQINKREWADVEAEMQHSADFVCQITDVRLLKGGTTMASFVVPVQYVHDVVQTSIDSQNRLCFIRVYLAPKRAFIDVDEGEGGETQP